MGGSFLKVTLRNLYREKMYAAINITGLSISIACCLILGLYLRSELTYDQHNTKHKQIYRVVNEINMNGKPETIALTSQILGEILTEEFNEVEGFVKFFVVNRKVLLRHEDKAFYWENTAFASKNVFDVFDHDFIYGDPKTIKNKRFVAVSESFARKYWGNENPVGKTIISEENTVKVTHVFKDLPENSHLKYDMLQTDDLPIFADAENVNRRRQTLWTPRVYTYLLMPEDYDVRNFKKISDSLYERHMSDLGKRLKATWRAWIQPLADIHYNSDVGYDEPTGNKHYLYGFTAVAIFILLVASVNYMNLATARVARRAKEVGMRKIMGSGRTRLVIQFLGEAIFFSFVAMVFGYVLVQVTLTITPINELLGKSLSIDFQNESILIGWMLAFSLVLGLISGLYPAFYLSSIAPISALVGNLRAGKGNIRLRELLVSIQFIISVTIVACTLLIGLQMHYIANKPLGFNKRVALSLIISIPVGI